MSAAGPSTCPGERWVAGVWGSHFPYSEQTHCLSQTMGRQHQGTGRHLLLRRPGEDSEVHVCASLAARLPTLVPLAVATPQHSGPGPGCRLSVSFGGQESCGNPSSPKEWLSSLQVGWSQGGRGIVADLSPDSEPSPTLAAL